MVKLSVPNFPPVELADENGLLCVGGELDTETILAAYKQGIFPWPLSEDLPNTWFAPPQRTILRPEKLQLSRSTLKTIRKSNWTFYLNMDFSSVIEHCQSSARKGQDGTWITDELKQGYTELFKAGHAYSLECYNGSRLVGGVYGVTVGGFLSGESMFFLESGASKACLGKLCELASELEIAWVDVQVETLLLLAIGAETVSRSNFMYLLGDIFPLNQPESLRSSFKLAG